MVCRPAGECARDVQQPETDGADQLTDAAVPDNLRQRGQAVGRGRHRHDRSDAVVRFLLDDAGVRCFGIPRDAGPDLRTLISVPLFHVTGCSSQLLVAAYVGGTSVIMPALDLPTLIEALPAERISYLVTVPAVYALLLRHPAFAAADGPG